MKFRPRTEIRTDAILERQAVRLLGGIDRDYGDGGEAVGAADAGAST